MGESKDKSFEENLAQLERDGFLLIKNALDIETVQEWRDRLYRRYERREYDRRNSVGNVSYNQLLKQEPEMTRVLIAHPSVAPYLKRPWGNSANSVVCVHTSTLTTTRRNGTWTSTITGINRRKLMQVVLSKGSA